MAKLWLERALAMNPASPDLLNNMVGRQAGRPWLLAACWSLVRRVDRCRAHAGHSRVLGVCVVQGVVEERRGSFHLARKYYRQAADVAPHVGTVQVRQAAERTTHRSASRGKGKARGVRASGTDHVRCCCLMVGVVLAQGNLARVEKALQGLH